MKVPLCDRGPACPTALLPIVKLADVDVVYGSGAEAVLAIRQITLEVRAGELLLLMGPSGSGKTSLLQVIGLLLPPSAGQLTLRGEALTAFDQRRMTCLRKSHCGFVFQSYNLLPNLTAIENVQLACELKGIPWDDGRSQASELIEKVGLGAKRDSYPGALSGGQKQRIAIARALAGAPDLVLADEPTAALDFQAGQHVMELLRRLANEDERAVVAVTHDRRATRFADRILVLQDGQIMHDQDILGLGDAHD